jgi:hypothetical protein
MSTLIQLNSYYAAVSEVTKTVDIQIADDDLTTLKQNGYSLCFAKKVNDSYTVVWQSSTQYLSDNTFSWHPSYQLFGTNTFQGSVVVKATTKIQSCDLGQICVLDSNGLLQPASDGGKATVLTFDNEFGLIHPGVNCLATNIEGNQVSTPIYVAQNAIVSGNDELTPVDIVQVWFQQNILTSTMLSNAVSNAVEIDMTSTNLATRLYQGGKWTTPSS